MKPTSLEEARQVQKGLGIRVLDLPAGNTGEKSPKPSQEKQEEKSMNGEAADVIRDVAERVGTPTPAGQVAKKEAIRAVVWVPIAAVAVAAVGSGLLLLWRKLI